MKEVPTGLSMETDEIKQTLGRTEMSLGISIELNLENHIMSLTCKMKQRLIKLVQEVEKSHYEDSPTDILCPGRGCISSHDHFLLQNLPCLSRDTMANGTI